MRRAAFDLPQRIFLDCVTHWFFISIARVAVSFDDVGGLVIYPCVCGLPDVLLSGERLERVCGILLCCLGPSPSGREERSLRY